MLTKLQRKTLVPTQILGYALTLFVGVCIILISVQIFIDSRPVLFQQSSIFNSQSVVVSKSVNIFKTLDKEGIYFSNEEIQELNEQQFIKDVSPFTSATFRIKARTPETGNIPVFYTDLFFESIAEKYLDIQPEDWNWSEDQDFLPIIIPEDYLNLYNFGFAESQGLPVISKNTVSQVEFIIQISGNGKRKEYSSKIVGFSGTINSILVPEDFMTWANLEFGNGKNKKNTRILVEFEDPSDERILEFFNQKNYEINKKELEFSKIIFYFKAALVFVFIIAMVIILLSVSFILMSVKLILQKNKTLLINLYHIGYSPKTIGKFYQRTIGIITLLSILLATIVVSLVRNVYLNWFENYFTLEDSNNQLILMSLILCISLLILYIFKLRKNIQNIVVPKKKKLNP